MTEQQPFYLGNWLVHPAKNKIQNSQASKNIQPKLMEVLTFLCKKQGEIINSDELIKQCWPNQFISDSPIHKCIAQLRKALSDSSKNPKYIATIPKRGYSIIAKVSEIQGNQQSIKPFWLGQAPFVGLKQYTSEQQEIFFGRSKAIVDILSLIDHKESESSLIMLLGQSGCGKSSLVQAGILPKLLKPYKSFKNKYLKTFTFVPASNSYQAADKFLLSFLYSNNIISHDLSLIQYHEYVYEDCNKIKQYIKPEAILTSTRDNDSDQIVIFIDQLEHLFANEQSSQIIANFFEIIRVLLESNTCLIISALRNEYYQDLTESHSYIQIRARAYHYDIPPLSYDEVCDIVRKPAQAAGLSFEMNQQHIVSLDTYIINKAQSINVSLPLLQYTLAELYKNKHGNVLNYLAYRNNGELEGVLSIVAEKAFLQLPISHQVKFEKLLHNLIQINPDSKNKISCKKAALKSFKDLEIKNIIDVFTNKRLFQTQWINNEAYVSITHDILITNWHRMDEWVKKNINLLNSRHEIKQATNRWIHHKKSKDFLLNSDMPIQSANTIIDNKQINLNTNEKAFINASNIKFSYTKRLKLGLVGSLILFLLISTVLALSIHTKNNQIMATKNNAESLISFILYDLKDKLAPLGRIELLDLVSSKTLEYFSTVDTEHLSETSLLHWVEALHIDGEVSFTQGDYESAYKSFSKSDDILSTALAKDHGNTTLLEKHMLCNYWLGYLNFSKNQYPNSEIYWNKYLKLAQTLSLNQPEIQKWQLELSYAFNNLGTLAISTNKLEMAKKYFSKSVAIKRSLLTNQPKNQVLIADLADSISWIGQIHQKEGNLKSKHNINTESLDLSRKLVLINSNNSNWSHRLSIAHYRVAISYYDLGELNQSKIQINESIRLMESLVFKDDSNYTFKKELINCYLLLSKIYRHEKQYDKSLYTLQKSKKLIDLFKSNLKYTKKIAKYNINLIIEQSLIMNEFKQYDRALESLNNALSLWQQYFSTGEEFGITGLALINLSKAEVIKSMPESEGNNNKIKKILIENKLKLEPFIGASTTNYKIVAMYLHTLKFLNISEGNSRELEIILTQAHYENPDYNATVMVN